MKMRMRYSHASPADLRATVDRLDGPPPRAATPALAATIRTRISTSL